MRYNQLGFVPQFENAFVNIPAIQTYVEAQKRETSASPTTSTGNTGITVPETPMPATPSSDNTMLYWALAAVGVFAIYYAIK